jgi:hypothetical protein
MREILPATARGEVGVPAAASGALTDAVGETVEERDHPEKQVALGRPKSRRNYTITGTTFESMMRWSDVTRRSRSTPRRRDNLAIRGRPPNEATSAAHLSTEGFGKRGLPANDRRIPVWFFMASSQDDRNVVI